MPKEGIGREEYRTAKFGSWERSLVLDAQVAAGEAEGFRFAHARIERTLNTLGAHRLSYTVSETRRRVRLLPRPNLGPQAP